MVPGCAEGGVVGEGVVYPPDSGGHEVGQEHINGVVTPAQEQEDHSARRHKEGGPVEEFEAARGILLYGQVSHGESHGVAGEYIISAENMLPID